MIKVFVDGQIRVTASWEIRKQLATMAQWDNPKWAENKRRGYPNAGVPKVIDLSEDTGSEVLLPRGLMNEVWSFVHKQNQKVEVAWDMVKMPFDAVPKAVDDARPYQREASRAFNWQGIEVMPCGGGKTYTACDIIGRRGQKTIILVHTIDLLDQWKDAIQSSLGIDAGTFQGKKREIRDVTVATVQTLSMLSSPELRKLFAQFGMIVLDEMHHCPAKSFQRLVNLASCYYRLGLTATAYRNDGLTPVLHAVFGEILYLIEQEELVAGGYLVQPTVQKVKTGCTLDEENVQVECKKCKGAGIVYEGEDESFLQLKCPACGGRGTQLDHHKVIEEICNDDERLGTICSNIIRDLESGHFVLCLATRKAYLEKIWARVDEEYPAAKARVLTSDTPKGLRRRYINEARAGECRLLCGTQLADEGLDIPRIDRIHLTLPAKAKSATIQRIGRMMRVHEDKTEPPILYDYVDDHGVFYTSWSKRRKYYLEIGAIVS